MAKDISETIGCDLGDKRTELCGIDAGGQVVERRSVRTTQQAMLAAFQRPPAHVVIEVGTHSRWVSTLLKSLGHRVTIANPRRVKLIASSANKTDRHDAELLARLGRADVKLLAPTQHRGMQAQADLAVIKARDALVATRTKLVNVIRGMVKSFGLRLPTCSAESFTRTAPLIPEKLRPALEPMYATLEALKVQISEHDKQVGRISKRYPETQAVSQPAGVGPVTALAFVLTVEDEERFAKSRMVGAYFGLQPRKRESGQTDPQLRITKAGDPMVRRLLVNAAHYVLGPFGPDTDLRRWGQEMAKRGGKNAKKRAVVAVARRLAVLMHRLWVTGEVYEPLGYKSRRVDQTPAAA